MVITFCSTYLCIMYFMDKWLVMQLFPYWVKNITRMHSSRMRTVRLLTVSRCMPCISGWGGSAQPPYWMQTSPPPDADHPLMQTPGHVTCFACWEATPPAPVNRMTHRCKNITLPQTSFAGSKYILMYENWERWKTAKIDLQNCIINSCVHVKIHMHQYHTQYVKTHCQVGNLLLPTSSAVFHNVIFTRFFKLKTEAVIFEGCLEKEKYQYRLTGKTIYNVLIELHSSTMINVQSDRLIWQDGVPTFLSHEIPWFPKIFPRFFLSFQQDIFNQKTYLFFLNVAFTYHWGSVYRNPQFITDTLPTGKTSPHNHTKSHVHFYYFLSIYPLLENFLNLKIFPPDFGWKTHVFPNWKSFQNFPWFPWSVGTLQDWPKWFNQSNRDRALNRYLYCTFQWCFTDIANERVWNN